MSEVELMDVIAGNLSSLMEEKGYSQRDLADDSGLSEAAISRYLKAQRIPNLKAIFNMCMVLDCEVEELVGYVDWVR